MARWTLQDEIRALIVTVALEKMAIDFQVKGTIECGEVLAQNCSTQVVWLVGVKAS